MGRPRSNTMQVTIRIPNTWHVRANRLRSSMEKPGWSGCKASVTDVLRLAIADGLESLERASTSAPPVQKDAASSSAGQGGKLDREGT